MKRKKLQKGFCKYCRKHTVKKVSVWKKRAPSILSKGQRKFIEVCKGYGGFPRPKPSGKKKIRKLTINYSCQDCSKIMMEGNLKAKKVEIL